jgi:hypothetical protein
MKQAELFGVYMQTSREAFNWLDLNRSAVDRRLTRRRTTAQHTARTSTDTEELYVAKELIKNTHTIHSRDFHYVALGEVGHAKVVKGGEGSASQFRFVSSENGGFVQMGLLSCFCAHCFQGKYSDCMEPHTQLSQKACLAVSGCGIGQRKAEARKFLNDRAEELVGKLKPGDNVFVWMDPSGQSESYRHKYEPMKVVEVDGDYLEMLNGRQFIKLAPYIPTDYADEDCREWIWNDSGLCSKQYSECYTAEHRGYQESTGLVWTSGNIGKGQSVGVCKMQHYDPKPITALRPPFGFQLDQVEGTGRRRSTRNQSIHTHALIQKQLVSPGLHQKVLQVLAEERAAYDAEWFVFRN